MLLILIIAFLPLWIAWTIYDLFRSDLRYVRRVEKLKMGEIDSMLRRHKSALWIHGLSTIVIALTMFWILGLAGIIAEIPFLLILGAHLQAFSGFRKGLNTGSARRKNEDTSRLVEQNQFDDEAVYTIGDDGELVEVKEQNHGS